MRAAGKIGVALMATACMTLGLASVAQATQQIESFSVSTSTTQAGGHPDLTTSFTLADNPAAQESAQDVAVNLPEGVFGNSNAVTQCTAADFALTQCPPNSQVGYVTVRARYQGDPNKLLGTAPIYALVPESETARFSFVVPVLNLPIAIPVAVRTGSDFGLRFTVAGITQLTPLASAQVTFWGFPADESNDDQRFKRGKPGAPAGCVELEDTSCIATPTEAGIPNRPLTTNPNTCTGNELGVTLSVRTYQDPTNLSHAQSTYPPTTGCEKQTFNPVLFANLTTNESDAPSGLDLGFSAPQFLGFAASPSTIRSVITTLPPGLTINPDAADGQSACTDAQANFGTELAAACPDNAKVGTFSIGSPTLAGRLNGSLYLGAPQPANPYRLFMAADGFGIHAKLKGTFHPDPNTGQLVASFPDLPQVPFDDFQLHLFASDRGLVATPTRCGVFPISARFFPWNAQAPDQVSTRNFDLNQGPGGRPCPDQVRPFSPRLAAGTTNPLAGAFSDFSLKLDRDDGDQFLGELGFRLPPGFSGYLRGIPYCPDAAIAGAAQRTGLQERSAPSCPASSAIGSSNVAAGPGSHPFHAAGKMYLAGPFKGAPLSTVVITPALAGPYDYGVVVVRVALHVDPLTAQVTALSDTVPAIIGGIPLRIRSIQVSIDRPNFTINPTNCSTHTVTSQGTGDQGTQSAFSSPFTAVNCSTLPFKPKMTVTQLGGRKATKQSRDPSLRFTLTTRPGDANLKAVAVTLPRAFAIDQEHLGNICSKAELARNQCQGRQAIGYATTKTPLLDEPLQGPAYAVSGFGKLPRLAFILGGQVTIVPEARSTSVKGGHLRTVVPVIPDAPIGTFTLTLLGGKQGYLQNTRDLCAAPATTEILFSAQNGKEVTQKVKTKTACPKAKRPQR